MNKLDLPLVHLHRPPAQGTDEPWLLVLMHGVGSNEQDLFGLAPHVPPRFHVLSLRAPNHMAGMPPSALSYAWFEFSVLRSGERVIERAQEAASREQIARTIALASRQLGVAAQRVVVGGFSQGGIMSLSLLLTQPQLMRAAMVMHSRLLPEIAPLQVGADSLAGRALWVSHGLQDGVIPLANAHRIRDTAAALPLALEYAEFPGGHEIRPAELRAAMTWLDGLA